MILALAVAISTLELSRTFVPYAGMLLANYFTSFTNLEYWGLFYVFDILGTFLVFIIGCFLLIAIIKKHPHILAMTIGLCGLIVFILEPVATTCMGVCGPPPGEWFYLAGVMAPLSASFTISFTMGA